MTYICTNDKYDNSPHNRYLTVVEFQRMCEACFGEFVELTTRDMGDTYEDADGETVLCRVEAG